MDEMELLLAILIAVGICYYYRVYKPKREKNERIMEQQVAETRRPAGDYQQDLPRGIEHNAADVLINSSHYAIYKSLFDSLRNSGDHPQYKIDWLLESLDMGKTLERNGYYVIQSIKEELPYFCETEYEYTSFFNEEKPILCGSLQGILDLMLQYAVGEELKHPSKLAYWQRQIKKMAVDGNMEAQAVLAGAKVTNINKNLFPENELDGYYDKYYQHLITASERGDPYAQLAVGTFLTRYASSERRIILTKATHANLSDAWYQLGKVYGALLYSDEDGEWRGNTLPEDKKRELEKKEMDCYIHAAEANNGIMAGWCQKHIAIWYEDGDGVLPLDLQKAKYWYERAGENGLNVKYSLKSLNEKLNYGKDV